MAKNTLKMIKTLTTPDDWKSWCQDMGFQKVDPNNFPRFVSPALAAKCHQGLIICSGSSIGFTGWFLPGRVDHDGIDIDPTIYTYNYETGEESSANIFHGDWKNRTITYPSGSMSDVMTASGFDPSFTVLQFPEEDSGSLEDLIEGGYVEGFRKPEQIFHRKKGKKK